jgi:hypothetical protein
MKNLDKLHALSSANYSHKYHQKLGHMNTKDKDLVISIL